MFILCVYDNINAIAIVKIIENVYITLVFAFESFSGDSTGANVTFVGKSVIADGIKVGSVVTCVGSIVGANDGAIVGSPLLHDP